MKVLLSWIRDFVDIKASAQEIAEKLALRGFEYASVESLSGGDGVIDFEVTANRPDCMSVVGFAREIATAYNLPFAARLDAADAREGGPGGSTGDTVPLAVTLEDADLCPRYAAAVAEVTAASSPSWMTRRLEASGVRPISPLVDVTNYVLMELGHPMHAFDLDRLSGTELRIRRAQPGETLTTLDGVARTLDADMLVIADARHAQAIAGVMGGSSSEVSGATRRVVFESAYFKPASIRRTSKRLGLKTEASVRFERGTDINAPVLALRRAAALVHRIGAGRLVGAITDHYPTPRGPRTLTLRRSRLGLVLGLAVPDSEVERILTALGLTVAQVGDGWTVDVPTFRVDLLREVDLIEEVGRHYGFEKLQPVFPNVGAAPPPPDARVTRDGLLRRVLTGMGLTEAIAFGFIEAEAARAFAPAGRQLATVANPLSAKFDTLRPSLLPGLIDAVAHNRRHGRRDVALFEIGARFTSSGETRAVALAWTGLATPDHWSGGSRDVDFFDVKGVVEGVLAALGAGGAVGGLFEPTEAAFLVPGQTARVRVGASEVGHVGQVMPALVERRGAPRHDKIFVAELDLDALGPVRGADAMERVAPLPRHPAVVRDLSIIVADTLPAAIIRGTILAAALGGAAPLSALAFFDRYKGKGVAGGYVSISVRLTFQADRTLTDADVQMSVDRILAALVREHKAVQR
jgi:phenylalanyl-tRNA synthetase beta chain